VGRLKKEKCGMFVLIVTALAAMRTSELLNHIFRRMYSLYISSNFLINAKSSRNNLL
jgi:hypothetical protein